MIQATRSPHGVYSWLQSKGRAQCGGHVQMQALVQHLCCNASEQRLTASQAVAHAAVNVAAPTKVCPRFGWGSASNAMFDAGVCLVVRQYVQMQLSQQQLDDIRLQFRRVLDNVRLLSSSCAVVFASHSSDLCGGGLQLDRNLNATVGLASIDIPRYVRVITSHVPVISCKRWVWSDVRVGNTGYDYSTEPSTAAIFHGALEYVNGDTVLTCPRL